MAAPALSKQASALSPTKQISLVEDHGGRGTFPFRATDDDGAPASTAVALAVKREASIEKTETERNARASARVSEGVGTRESVEERLRSTGYLPHGHELFMHGRAYTGKTTPPQAVWVSKKKPRDDHDAPTWLTATEYQDSAEVAAAKVRQLAELLRLSRRTVLYTGAGISASVIGQAARSGANKQGWMSNTREAAPTPTHVALGLLGQHGVVHSWVQQNHDGLPQKAGFPQEHICEIHGSWYDPSNPVVKYSGSVKDQEWEWLQREVDAADLVLVIGTSLGGLAADELPLACAARSLATAGTRTTPAQSRRDRRGGALGAVCMNLQQTEQDGKMSLRMFGRSDDLLRLLLVELADLGVPRLPRAAAAGAGPSARWPTNDCVLVPYDDRGRRLPMGGDDEEEGEEAAGGRSKQAKGAQRRMWLDLREGARVRITPGHNIQGARQPGYMHIGAKKPQTIKGVTRQPAPGVGVVVQREDASCSYVLQIEGTLMRLGLWWLEAAARGGPQSLPLVNVSPLYEGDAPQGLSDAQPAAAPRGAARGPAAAKAALRAPSKAAGKAVAAPPAAAPAAAAPSSKAKAKGKAKASGLLLDGAEAMEARLLGADAAAASRKAKTAAVRAMNDLMSEYAALGG